MKVSIDVLCKKRIDELIQGIQSGTIIVEEHDDTTFRYYPSVLPPAIPIAEDSKRWYTRYVSKSTFNAQQLKLVLQHIH